MASHVGTLSFLGAISSSRFADAVWTRAAHSGYVDDLQGAHRGCANARHSETARSRIVFLRGRRQSLALPTQCGRLDFFFFADAQVERAHLRRVRRLP